MNWHPNRLARCRAAAAAAVFLIGLAGTEAGAARLSGSLTSSFYAWDADRKSGDDGAHCRLYAALITDVSGIASDQISFHGQFYGSGDVAASAGNSLTRISRSYIKWRSDRFTAEVLLGRIFVSGGLLPATIDGFSGVVRAGKSASIYGCAGAMVQATASPELASWEDSHLIGASVRGLAFLNTKFGCGFWRRTRRRQGLGEVAAWKQITSDDLAEQTFFLEGTSRPAKRLTAGFSIQYDEPNSELRKAHTRFSVSLSENLQAQPYFLYRRPYIDANSIFSVFSQEPITEYGMGMRYVLRHARYAFSYSHTLHHEDSSDRIRLDARYRSLSVRLGLSEGYVGDGVSASGSYAARVFKNVIFRPSVSYRRFRFSGVDRGKNETFSSRLALSCRVGPNLVVDIEGQGLSQDIRSQVRTGFIGYRYDVRFLVRLRYMFGLQGMANL